MTSSITPVQFFIIIFAVIVFLLALIATIFILSKGKEFAKENENRLYASICIVFLALWLVVGLLI